MNLPVLDTLVVCSEYSEMVDFGDKLRHIREAKQAAQLERVYVLVRL
jgi:cell division protein ZapA (FtsZ GTPase activity inhibitor)